MNPKLPSLGLGLTEKKSALMITEKATFLLSIPTVNGQWSWTKMKRIYLYLSYVIENVFAWYGCWKILKSVVCMDGNEIDMVPSINSIQSTVAKKRSRHTFNYRKYMSKKRRKMNIAILYAMYIQYTVYSQSHIHTLTKYTQHIQHSAQTNTYIYTVPLGKTVKYS